MYSVQFVGLACFLRGQDSRFVMFPDGRNPGDGIEPHYASIVVDGGAVERATGWEDETAVSQGVFALPPCSVNIQTVSDSGTLDTSAHDGRLPELRQIDPNFIIDRDHAMEAPGAQRSRRAVGCGGWNSSKPARDRGERAC